MRKLLPLAALGLVLASAAPAAAASQISVGVRAGGVAVQYNRGRDWRRDRWMDRGEVERRIYRAGYVRVYGMDRYGDRYYQARCVDSRGAVFVLTIDAFSGGIVRAQYVGRERYRRW